jgi:hypothetical protein
MTLVRVILGFAAAGITPIMIGFFAALSYFAASHRFIDAAREAVIATGNIAVEASLVVTAACIPVYWVAKRRGLNSVLFYIAHGAAISIVIATYIGLSLNDHGYFDESAASFKKKFIMLELAAVLISGPLAAIAFWCVVRPDRVTAAAAPSP